MKSLGLSLVALLVLQIALFAAAANSATVKFDEPVTVGTSTLRPGEYKVTWTGVGTDSKVTFSQGKKEIAVVPATVADKKNADTQIFTATAGTGKILQGINLKNTTLTFGPAATAGK